MPWPELLPAFLAFALAAPLAWLGRARPWLGGLALGAGLVLGWWALFGHFPASPRQLPERLPLLALAMLGWSAAATALPARGQAAVAFAGALAVGWWMAGAPRTVADLAQAAPTLAAVALACALALRPRGRWRQVLAAAALLAGLGLAALPGPAVLLGMILLAAALGAAVASRDMGAPNVAFALPLAACLVSLGALPALARGTAWDWVPVPLALLVLWWPRPRVKGS